MTKIYESPDGGATIYAREHGSTERTIVREDTSTLDRLRESKMWGEIRRMAKTNAAMKEYTDRCIELYYLLKDHK